MFMVQIKNEKKKAHAMNFPEQHSLPYDYIDKCHLPLLLAPTLPAVTDALTWLILHKLFITI